MRPDLVVVHAPCLGRAAGFKDAPEGVHVEQLIADFSVEGFDVCVLRRLAGRDEMSSNTTVATPTQHCQTRKLGSVVEADGLRKPALKSEVFKLADNVCAAER